MGHPVEYNLNDLMLCNRCGVKQLVLLVVVLWLVAYVLVLTLLLDDQQTPNNNSDGVVSIESGPVGGNDHHLCIIVPYRDRFEELQTFVPYMSEFLAKQNIKHTLIVVNQVDELRFNRASLINVGFIESVKPEIGCDYVCMHDVDLLPVNSELSYSYPDKSGPYHIASPDYHPRYNYTKFIGGILMLTADQFRRIDGMSNQYWGWGLEDDELFLRFRDANMTIYRPIDLTTGRNNTFVHIHNARVRKRDSVKLPKQREMTRRRDRKSGLHNVAYRVLSRVRITIDSHPFTIINTMLICDRSWTPYCELPTTTTSTSSTGSTDATTTTTTT